MFSVVGTVETAGVGYVERKNDTRTVRIELGKSPYNVTGFMTPEVAEKLYAQLGAVLQDLQRQAHPETCEDGSQLLAVIGDDTVTATQLREIMDEARRNAQRQGPMGERELCERIRTEGAVDAEEVARRAGF